jgi:microcystin-dependent protein
MAITLNGTTGISSPAINAGNIVGQVCFFAMSTAPTGFLKCNGATISRTTYADLFAVIGTTYGSGDGSTTFTLPELRGEFLRSLDDGRGVDSGRAIGTAQADAFQGHYHGILRDATGSFADTITVPIGRTNSYYTGGYVEPPTDYRRNYLTDGLNGTPRYAAETRPRNVALLACIKF